MLTMATMLGIMPRNVVPDAESVNRRRKGRRVRSASQRRVISGCGCVLDSGEGGPRTLTGRGEPTVDLAYSFHGRHLIERETQPFEN